jgi:hypothetical protein
MEPYWNEVKMSQVIGRAVRIKSHADLPPEERNVDIYRYIMKFTREELGITNEQKTTDEFIYEIAQRKKTITDDILNMLREMAIDCTLNSRDNGGLISCYTYGQDAEGLAYQTNIREDIVSGYQNNREVREITKKLLLGGITDTGIVVIPDNNTKQLYRASNRDKIKALGKVKIVRKVGIDTSAQKVYDYNSMKMNNLIEIGRYNENGEFVAGNK